MIFTNYLIRFAKRFAIFLPAIVIAYVSFKYTIPFLDKRLRLPDLVSILVAYALAAYVLLPAIIRLWRIVRPPEHLPLYCVTPDGFASDPINIGIVSTRHELIMAMEKAGWYLADPHTPRYLLRHILSIVLGWDYATAPVSSLYMFGRKQDLAFEIPTNGTPLRRHHVRFWATTYQGNKQLTAKSIHWHHRRAHVQGDRLLWVGSASLDIGIIPIRHNFQLTHMVHPDTNQERDLIVDNLKSQKLVKTVEKVKLGKPYRLTNRALSSVLHTDGSMTVVWLKTAKKQ